MYCLPGIGELMAGQTLKHSFSQEADLSEPLHHSPVSPFGEFSLSLRQKESDIQTLRDLSEAVPAMRRYLSHRLRNDAQLLMQSEIDGDCGCIERYIGKLTSMLKEVGL